MIISLLFSSLFSFAQQPIQKTTSKTAGGKRISPRGSQSMALTSVPHDTCLDKKFSVVIYYIQDSLDSKTVANTATLSTLVIGILNNAFRRICVSFQNCSTVIVPIYPYNKWRPDITDQIFVDNWYTENVINLYLPERMIMSFGYEGGGYAHAPNTPGAKPSVKPVMVASLVEPNALFANAVGFAGSTLVHVAGHFFGLPDTFSEIGPPASPGPPSGVGVYEFARRTNCHSNGDGFCDTDADPFPVHYWTGPAPPPKTWCYYEPGIKDGEGFYYNPPIDNLMSLYNCRCRFTQEQYNYMAKFIVANRLNLH